MSTSSTNPSNALNALSAALSASAARARILLVLRAVAWILAALIACVLVITLIDYTLRFPVAVRIVLLIALLAFLWKLAVKLLFPAIRARFSPVDLALRIERTDKSSSGLLASTVDLQAQHPADPIESALRDAALARAASRASKPASILLTRHTLVGVAALLAILLLCAIPLLTAPSLSRIGLQRTLAPWSGASWPKRFTITNNTPSKAHAIDETLPIRIRVSPSTSDARAAIVWRIVDETGKQVTPSTRTMLAAQPIDEQLEGRAYEHLLDTRSIADRYDNPRFTLEYSIETRDDETRKARITLARPPILLETSIVTQLPEYARDANPGVLLAKPQSTHEDGQIATPPMLVGSTSTLLWSFSKPIELPQTIPNWLRAAESKISDTVLSQPTPESVELRFVVQDPVLFEPLFRDELGITVRAPVAIDLPVHTDAPSSGAVTVPDRDIMITTHAIIDLSAEFTDDIGLESASVTLTHASVPADSPGAMPEPAEPITLLTANNANAPHALLSGVLRVEDSDPAPGDELWINARSQDLLGSSASRAPSISETRVLRVVDDQTMIEHLQSAIIPIQPALQRLDEQQSVLQDRQHAGELESAQEQRSLGDQIRSQQRALAQIERTAAQNTIEDPALRSLLHDAESTLNEAAQAAQRAADAIDQNRDARAEQEQQTVRDRLGEVLSRLDRGQDSWLARRSVQQLRDELERLNNETSSLSETTAGKQLSELSADERSALEQILDRQRRAAEDASAMLDELDERAEQLQKSDPTQAEALRRAAAQGRGSQVRETLEQGADELSNNQTGAASRSQQAAIDELDTMLEEIDHAAQNRDSALRRQLASIIEQLETLIASQHEQLTRVHSGEADLDIAMIRVVENTLAIRDSAIGAFPETQIIAEHINSAADAQSLAVSALRAAPSNPNEAEQQERNALNRLEQALAEAQRLDQQAADRESRRLRNELRTKYSEALETQVALRDAAAPMLDRALSRKERSEARTLAKSQEELRVQIDALIADTEELSEASVFEFAHAQINRHMDAAARAMGGRTLAPTIADNHASSIHLLSALVDVLSQSKQKEQDFEDGQSQGGSSGSPSSGEEEPLIPPVAQLKLLRSIQQLAAMQTRSLAESGSSDPDSIAALIELQQEIATQGQELINQLSQPQQQHEPMEIAPPEQEEQTE